MNRFLDPAMACRLPAEAWELSSSSSSMSSLNNLVSGSLSSAVELYQPLPFSGLFAVGRAQSLPKGSFAQRRSFEPESFNTDFVLQVERN